MNKPDSSRDLAILIISFISLFEIINVVVLDPNLLSWIPAYAAAINLNGIKTLLANGLSVFSLMENQFLVTV